MAGLGSITALTILGLSGLEAWDEGSATPIVASDTASLSVTDTATAPVGLDPSEWTELAVTGLPGPIRDDIEAATPPDLVGLVVSDTASLSATESPVDSQEIDTTDIALLSVTESVALFNNIDATDSASLGLSETVNVEASGTPDFPVTETASLTLTETAVLDVEITVTDTASITATEDPGTVDVSTDTFDVTDTGSLSVTETYVLDIFTGVVAVNVDDVTSLLVSEASVIEFGNFGDIARIQFSLRKPTVKFTIH